MAKVIAKKRVKSSEFGSNKPFIPKRFQVAKKVDGPKVTLLKSICRTVQVSKHPKNGTYADAIFAVMGMITNRIDREAKKEGTYYRIPKSNK